MTSGVRNLLSEAVLWLSIFIIALAGFLFLDDRIGNFMENDPVNSSPFSKDPTASLSRPTRTPRTNDEDDSADSVESRVTLHAGRSGHFKVKAFINDNSINLLADTGATYVVLTYADADSLDLADGLKFTGRARTANGISKVAPLTLETIEVGDIIVHDVKAFVAQEGKLSSSLLGMSFIGRLSSFKMSGKELILEQ